jgi:hypothetical protein
MKPTITVKRRGRKVIANLFDMDASDLRALLTSASLHAFEKGQEYEVLLEAWDAGQALPESAGWQSRENLINSLESCRERWILCGDLLAQLAGTDNEVKSVVEMYRKEIKALRNGDKFVSIGTRLAQLQGKSG